MLETIEKEIQKTNLTVLSSFTTDGKMEITFELLIKWGLKDKKRIRVLDLEGDDSYFLEHIIGILLDTDPFLIHGYFHPCSTTARNYHKQINKEQFLSTLKDIQESNIWLSDVKYVQIDILDYILSFYKDQQKDEILILNSLNLLFQKSKYPKEEILKKLKDFAEKESIHLLLLTNAAWQKKLQINSINDYETLKKFIDVFILSKRKDRNSKEYQLQILIKTNDLEKKLIWKGRKYES